VVVVAWPWSLKHIVASLVFSYDYTTLMETVIPFTQHGVKDISIDFVI